MQAGHKEGYLTKRGKNFGGWKTRFFVLQGPVLEYYDCVSGLLFKIWPFFCYLRGGFSVEVPTSGQSQSQVHKLLVSIGPSVRRAQTTKRNIDMPSLSLKQRKAQVGTIHDMSFVPKATRTEIAGSRCWSGTTPARTVKI